jgi:hypothetical protein
MIVRTNLEDVWSDVFDFVRSFRERAHHRDGGHGDIGGKAEVKGTWTLRPF